MERPPSDTSGYYVNDFLTLPGQWRPQCCWEHIAWVSPPWPSQFYLWLDFPEAVFCDQGNLFLSHINTDFPALFPDLPAVTWSSFPAGLSVTRKLPNGVEFESRLEKRGTDSIGLQLQLRNGSDLPVRHLRVQTCTYMRAIKEFSDLTNDNKYVCGTGTGWTRLEDWKACRDTPGTAAGIPVIATCSSEGERLVGMTWFQDTERIWGNAQHPCMHADPGCRDLEPGENAKMEGALFFFEGSLGEFAEWFRAEYE